MLAAVCQRLGDSGGAQSARAIAAEAIETIVAGTREPELRESFLALEAVREVLEGRIAL